MWYINSMEEWRIIKDFPNYSVSDFGNVKNNKTNRIMKLSITPFSHLKRPFYMKNLSYNGCFK